MLVTYINDPLFIGVSAAAITKAKTDLVMLKHKTEENKPALEIKVLGTTSMFLNMVFKHADIGLFVHQTNYIDHILHHFPKHANKVTTLLTGHLTLLPEHDMLNPVGIKHYQLLLGSLMHLTMVTCPNIAYAVGFVLWFVSAPNETHLKALHQTLLFVVNMRNFELCFTKTGELHCGLKVYMDASFTNNMETSCSTLGIIIMTRGAAVSWALHCQPWVAMSMAKAEINTAMEAVHKAKWIINLSNLLAKPIGSDKLLKGLAITKDNLAACNIVEHGGIKCNVCHVTVRIQFLKENMLLGYKLKSITLELNMADTFTKLLPVACFTDLSTKMGLVLESALAKNAIRSVPNV